MYLAGKKVGDALTALTTKCTIYTDLKISSANRKSANLRTYEYKFVRIGDLTQMWQFADPIFFGIFEFAIYGPIFLADLKVKTPENPQIQNLYTCKYRI